MGCKYILIQNDGEIETNSFELIGASTKRGETGKIGFFGSGLKYSIAYMMRNGIDFRIFSGNNELKFTTTPENLKDKTFDRICINGKPTSYTVTMGPTWKEDWFVLREIYCNALDEGNCIMVKNTDNPCPSEGKTRIYISLTEGLQKVIDKWDSYFCDERDPLFVAENVYTSFIGTEDVGGTYKQSVKVYEHTEGVVFRKGIRVYHNKRLAYDYDFDFLNINEDRTARSMSGFSYCISDLIGSLCNEDYVVNVLMTGADEKPCEEYFCISSTNPDTRPSSKWVKFSNDYLLVVKETSGKYAEEILKSKKQVLLVPQYFIKEIKKVYPQIVVLGMGKSIGDTGMTEITPTSKMNFLLKEVTEALKQINYNVCYDISIVQFDDDNTLGAAELSEKKIYLSDRVFDMGRREIAMTIIEETEHIYSKKEDETRGFQNHLISEWLKTMENANGLFL